MKISKPAKEIFSDTSVKEDLELFLQQPGPELLAPCPGCTQHVRNHCSASCLDAPKALSIDPEQYPIERNVVPITYEIMATRLMQTCWSCEGHMDEKDVIWKLPQVCFYTASPIYVKLLHLHLIKLNQQENLAYNWHIVIVDFAQTSGLTYSIQPNLNHVKEPRLGLLQRDLNIIAEDLHENLKVHAQNIIDNP